MKRLFLSLLFLILSISLFAGDAFSYREENYLWKQNKEESIKTLFLVGFDYPAIPYIYNRELNTDLGHFSSLITNQFHFLHTGEFDASEKTKIKTIIDGKLEKTKVTGATLLNGEANVYLDFQHRISDKLTVGFVGTIPTQIPTIIQPEYQL